MVASLFYGVIVCASPSCLLGNFRLSLIGRRNIIIGGLFDFKVEGLKT